MDNENDYSQAIFWIEASKIEPNPFQPRREFSQEALESLADSIRQYGVLQPLVVTRKEQIKDDGGIVVSYELIAGERRLRAARLAGVSAVPAVIRKEEDSDKVKLELAIIENIQREDLSPLDRAKAFAQLVTDFNLTHLDVAKKIGRSREYVSNSIRLLALPEHVLKALSSGKLTEGHTRPILMLNDRPEEQSQLFRDIIEHGITVREAESMSRRLAKDKIRKPHRIFDRDTIELEEKLAEKLGTRVRIEKKEKGGKILIEFFSPDDLDNILKVIAEEQLIKNGSDVTNGFESLEEVEEKEAKEIANVVEDTPEDDLYSIKNFSI